MKIGLFMDDYFPSMNGVIYVMDNYAKRLGKVAEVVVVVPIGHVAPDCPKADKKRKPLTDIMDVI